MWPRSQPGVVQYRNRLRRRECELIVERLRHRFPQFNHIGEGTHDLAGSVSQANGHAARVLEFGSGGGHQIPVLTRVGRVVATDVYLSPHLRLPDSGCTFALCDVSHAPFQAGSFDLVFSNHVLEHIRELDLALEEIQRIGAPDCVFAFSVPTPLWLFLSLPPKYLDRAKRLIAFLGRRLVGRCHIADYGSPSPLATRQTEAPRASAGPSPRSWKALLLPQGHGEFVGFWQAVWGFRESAWRRRFLRHGLAVIERRNLLLYATARWPFIPMNRLGPKLGLASSRLFILQRAADHAASA